MTLIISLLTMVTLTMLGTVAYMNATSEVKISANYKNYSSAFYIADAGIEDAKGFIATLGDLNDILDGADNDDSTVGDNGIVFTNKAIAGGSYTVTIADDNDDGDPWVDSNSVVVVTSTGTGPNNSSGVIEAYVRMTPFEFPGAISFIDNDNGDPDEEDEVDVDINFWVNGDGSGNIKGMVITGYDTLDGSPNAGDGPGPDVAGMAVQEGPVGFNEQDASFANMTTKGIDEGPEQICTPVVGPPGAAPCWHMVSGDPGGPLVDAPTGPSEADMKTMYADFKARALEENPALVLSTSNNGGWPATIGTPANPKIAVIGNGAGQVNFTNDLEGYGILLIEGRLRIQAIIRWHGVIYITCRGGISLNNNNSDLLEVWGGIAMINYDDNDQATCSGGSDEERFHLRRGKIHIYYSTEAIQNYAMPFGGLTTLAWREL